MWLFVWGSTIVLWNSGSTEGLCLPPINCIKVNYDGAYDNTWGKGGIGVIVRNFNGAVANGIIKTCKEGSAFMAEALALRKAVNMAVCVGLVNVVFESHCLELILTIKNRLPSTHWIAHLCWMIFVEKH